MIDALERYLVHAAQHANHLDAVVTALESIADHPWEVVRLGTLLTRSVLDYADEDIGITRRLQRTTPGGKHAVLTVDAGQPFPLLTHVSRRERAAVDPPLDMARRVVAATLAAADGPVRTALDAACGTGAFLLALKEAGVPEIYGTDLDEVALAVAQIAVPEARLLRQGALKHGPPVDVLVGNPPYIPPERQDVFLRAELRRRCPWLGRRFDLAVPFAGAGIERVRAGGAAGLVLPSHTLVQPYAALLRRRWLQRHRIAEISGPHLFTSTKVSFVVLGVEQTPAPLPVYGIEPGELLRLKNAPFNPDLMPGDVDLVQKIRRLSVPLHRITSIDTGLIVNGPQGSEQRMIHEEPAEGRVPYADALDFFSGRFGYLDYDPDKLHRPKTRALFEQAKIVVQVARNRGAVRAAIDWDGVFVGHTCATVTAGPASPPLERLLELLRSPLADAVGRIEAGQRVDLHPKALGRVPVPRVWLDQPDVRIVDAWDLSRDEQRRLERLAQ